MPAVTSIPNSIILLPRADWANALRSGALTDVPAHDLTAYLQAFREHSEFYQQRLDGVTRWDSIPPLEKHELARMPVLRNTDEEIHEVRTSGTSGAQVTVRNTLTERRFRQALAYRPFLFYPLSNAAHEGVHQVIFVDGNDVEAPDKEQWPFAFDDHTFFTWHVGIAAEPDQILKLLQAVQPQVIRGLASGIVRFVEHVHGPLDGLGVQVVSPSGEQLLSEWRVTMTSAFNAPVLDRYGATETGSIAWQCPYCGDYHANSDELILEQSAAGLLATPLFISSQPLLRYQLGDRVELHDDVASGSHDCRIRLPTLTVIDARRDDWLIDGAGRKVSPLSFQFERIPGLQAWRLHQHSGGGLRLYFDAEPGADIGPQLAEHLQAIVPDCRYELTQGIWQLQRAGKFKRVSSDIVHENVPH